MPHIHEKIDFCVDVFVVNDNAVLIRKHDKYKAWLSVGGHVELDEEPTAAAIREVKEEVGLDVELIGTVPMISENTQYRELLPPAFMNIHPITPDASHQHISLVYFARSTTRDTQQGETEISEELRWFTEEELDDPAFELRDTIRHYAKAALAAARK